MKKSNSIFNLYRIPAFFITLMLAVSACEQGVQPEQLPKEPHNKLARGGSCYGK